MGPTVLNKSFPILSCAYMTFHLLITKDKSSFNAENEGKKETSRYEDWRHSEQPPPPRLLYTFVFLFLTQ